MKFIVGLATGIVLGAAGAVAYSVKSGQDLRELYQGVRSDIEKGDLDALGARFESGIADLQAQMEERINQVKATAATAIDDANKAVDEARAQAASTADRSGNGFAHAADTAADAAESAVATASDAASDAAAAATDAVSDATDVGTLPPTPRTTRAPDPGAAHLARRRSGGPARPPARRPPARPTGRSRTTRTYGSFDRRRTTWRCSPCRGDRLSRRGRPRRCRRARP